MNAGAGKTVVRLAAVLGMWPTMASAQEVPLTPSDDYVRAIARDCHSPLSRQIERPAEARALFVLRIPLGPSAQSPVTGETRYAPTFDARADFAFGGSCERRRRPLASYSIVPQAGLVLGWAPGE